MFVATATLAKDVNPAATKPEKDTRSAEEKKAAELAARTAVGEAVATLTKEYQAYLKDEKKSPLRKAPDYFTQHPCPQLTPTMVFEAVDRIGRTEPQAAGYIQWQLSSALPQELTPAQSSLFLTALRRGPSPQPHPGLIPANRALWERALRRAKVADFLELNKKIIDDIAKTEAANLYILKYRESLYQRLPVTYDVITAGLEEAYRRVQLGVTPASQLGLVADVIARWSTDDKVNEGQKRNLAQLLKTMTTRKGPECYGPIDEKSIPTNEKAPKPPFSKKGYSMGEGNILQGAAESLAQSSSSPAGGLKFKDKN